MDQKILEIKKKELREILACTNKEQREKWLREYALEEGRRIGKEKGYADYRVEMFAGKFVEGYLEGFEEENKKNVLNMHKLNVPVERISLYLNIPIEEVKDILSIE